MLQRFDLDSQDLLFKAESLIVASPNRYHVTLQIARRAKQARYEEMENLSEETGIKPVLRAILEMSDELNQPEIIGG
ncbi:DNA-directed RNA polymerase subunit omega [Synechococcus elongatus]|uniref:DNA-directed RNA polymerase subunit omega n=2 Tax=Synechococcus elongatus TaxID=32046 RepID=A0AAN1QNT5_SYNEL|nr:DNA-directed RNA polymerase subunit omega [Synechococcus elongatus]AZB72621.1 DNA-directed RNA polymerase subunit omega [Synechococcus elongatus PCC 11801]QFZ92720.1 DNA-directed RNA polymerase subunit omega [Synechococcus elongatus PCC 11802]